MEKGIFQNKGVYRLNQGQLNSSQIETNNKNLIIINLMHCYKG